MPSLSPHTDMMQEILEMISVIDSTHAYITMINHMFSDGIFTFFRGYVLKLFTENLIDTHTHIAHEIVEVYNKMIIDNYDPMEALLLILL